MPYVPSKKTDGKSTDREVLDQAVEIVAKEAAGKITNNLSLIGVYKNLFLDTAWALKEFFCDGYASDSSGATLAKAIFAVTKNYDYEGVYLGELNYAITRFIQRVPQIMVEEHKWDQEFCYWLYAATIEALTCVAVKTQNFGIGVGGVFEDIKDEYKRRVNTTYEAEQILKSGDCYDTPYYTRLVRVVDEKGAVIGYQEIMLKRSGATIGKDLLDFSIVARKTL